MTIEVVRIILDVMLKRYEIDEASTPSYSYDVIVLDRTLRQRSELYVRA
jgi:hypothetical protein